MNRDRLGNRSVVVESTRRRGSSLGLAAVNAQMRAAPPETRDDADDRYEVDVPEGFDLHLDPDAPQEDLDPFEADLAVTEPAQPSRELMLRLELVGADPVASVVGTDALLEAALDPRRERLWQTRWSYLSALGQALAELQAEAVAAPTRAHAVAVLRPLTQEALRIAVLRRSVRDRLGDVRPVESLPDVAADGEVVVLSASGAPMQRRATEWVELGRAPDAGVISALVNSGLVELPWGIVPFRLLVSGTGRGTIGDVRPVAQAWQLFQGMEMAGWPGAGAEAARQRLSAATKGDGQPLGVRMVQKYLSDFGMIHENRALIRALLEQRQQLDGRDLRRQLPDVQLQVAALWNALAAGVLVL